MRERETFPLWLILPPCCKRKFEQIQFDSGWDFSTSWALLLVIFKEFVKVSGLFNWVKHVKSEVTTLELNFENCSQWVHPDPELLEKA